MKKFLEEFKAFAMRGNVLDMAVGVVIGSAFTSIVNSLVADIITPPALSVDARHQPGRSLHHPGPRGGRRQVGLR